LFLLSKDALRRALRTIRSAIAPPQHLIASQAASKTFADSFLLDKVQHIACYYASGDEFDTLPLIETIWKAGKNCYLPVLSTQDISFLNFAEFKPDDSLVPNRYKILEPNHTRLFPTENLDLVFVPLLGFDLHGHRLGSGGGYYDKTFHFLLGQKKSKPLLIGLGYKLQEIAKLPHDNWDVPLDGVLTEEKLILF